jgi:hypothetical protein
MSWIYEVLGDMLAPGLSGLRRVVIALPVVWTGAWLGYYGQSSLTLDFTFLKLDISLYRYNSEIPY